MNDICLFCRIIRGDEPGYVVLEDDVTFGFLDQRPLFPGHCLLTPKAHYQTMSDLPADLIAPLFSEARLLAEAIEKGLEADGSFVAINNRVSQSVPHLHIHIVPRRRKDGLKGFFWPRHHYKDQETIVSIQRTLQRAIAQLQSADGERP
ncbi:MAG TPA: HIT family protein [Nitrospiraceae bacterium]|nr:HIT family protein [Nitrospiraceae bacterium]